MHDSIFLPICIKGLEFDDFCIKVGYFKYKHIKRCRQDYLQEINEKIKS